MSRQYTTATSGLTTERSTGIAVFDCLNRIVDGGHLADLTGLEVKVLLVYLRHADNKTGRAFPAVSTIARRVGVRTLSRVRSAIRGLERRGLLYSVTPGGGSATAVRQVLVPESESEPDSGRESTPVENRPGSESDPGAGSKTDPGPRSKTDPGGGSKTDPRTTHRTTHGTTHGTTHTLGVCEKLSQALGRCGISATRADAMIREHGVQTVREVLRLTTFRKEQGTLQNPMGFIIHCLKNGYDLQELEEKPWNEQEQLLVPGDQWKGIPTTIQDAIDLGIITPEQLRASG